MKPNGLAPIARQDGLKWILVGVFGLIMLGVMSMGVQAGDHQKRKEPTRSIYLVKYVVDGEVRYARKAARKIVTITAARYKNSNAYVCTPSGFGRKARCFVPAR